MAFTDGPTAAAHVCPRNAKFVLEKDVAAHQGKLAKAKAVTPHGGPGYLQLASNSSYMSHL